MSEDLDRLLDFVRRNAAHLQQCTRCNEPRVLHVHDKTGPEPRRKCKTMPGYFEQP